MTAPAAPVADTAPAPTGPAPIDLPAGAGPAPAGGDQNGTQPQPAAVDNVRSAARGDQSPQQPTPGNTGPGAQQQGDTAADGQPAGKLEDLPSWAQREIQHARKGEEAKRVKAAELEKKVTAQATEFEQYRAKQDQMLEGVAKLFGLTEGDQDKDGKAQAPDPEKLAADLGEVQRRYRERTIELAVHRAAGSHGGDAERLLDSRAFADKVHGLDPDADDFPDKIGAAIKDAVASNPIFKSAPTAAPSAPSGGTFAGGPGTTPDVSNLSVEDFRTRRREQRRPIA